MATNPHPKDDTRTVDELVNAALCETDELAYLQIVRALNWKGTREVTGTYDRRQQGQASS